jgi:hypothetical protein
MNENDLLFLMPFIALLCLIFLKDIFDVFYTKYLMHKNMLNEWKHWEGQL